MPGLQPVAVITCRWHGYDPGLALAHAEPDLQIRSISLSATALHLNVPELDAERVRDWMEDHGLIVIRSTRTGSDTRRQWQAKYSLLIGQQIAV